MMKELLFSNAVKTRKAGDVGAEDLATVSNKEIEIIERHFASIYLNFLSCLLP